MGNADTKLNFRKAIVQLTSKSQPIDASDDVFWEQFWCEHSTSVQDVFALIPSNEIRKVRDVMPANLATLCYKATERLVRAVDNSCRTQGEQQTVLNCVRLLNRILPYIFEDAQWKDFFWSSLPSGNDKDDNATPLAQSLLNAICDLLFCPDFTVVGLRKSGPEKAEELNSIDSCEYIWEAGVGFAQSPPRNGNMDSRRTELLKLLLTCFSETMYRVPTMSDEPNKWIVQFTSAENRHALPLFTSLLNTVCAYDPVGIGVPYNHLLFTDTLEPLVEVCLQILIVTLDHDITGNSPTQSASYSHDDTTIADNLFINYLSRIHRDDDFQFILKGVTRLLNNPLVQSYLPNSTKRLHCHQELLVFFWKICDYNKKFLYFVLKSSDVLDILVPILYHLNDSRADQSRVGLMHIGVFILLLLSGERNFGVRLNKPYTATVPMDIPVFTGTHADLLITVFHKIIATGHQRLQPLFDCLLTILVNVSPYLKTLSMVASIKLLHLLEAFSTPWFLYSAPSNHHLVFFLLEIFNNIIQYQFDGNSNLVYTIIRKRQVFHALANLPTDSAGIARCMNNKKGGKLNNSSHATRHISRDKEPTDVLPPAAGAGDESEEDITIRTENLSIDIKHSDEEDSRSEIVEESMEGSRPALPAEPGTLKATLLDTPNIAQMTERESAHPLGEVTATPSVENVNASVGTVVKAGSPKGSPSKELPSPIKRSVAQRGSIRVTPASGHNSQSKIWQPAPEWVQSWRSKLPLQTIMRLLQVLVPQVEKICIDKGLTDESEILKFLQHGTLVGLLPVPHPILIRKYQANSGTTAWFRTYMWGVIYLRNVDPAIWYDTEVKLFEIQRV
ncbi:protein HID1 [Toxorhynchites rutilus septentrionalis]|uniref:protein HID1 n=1 Tax=Toxorhynchites rutilus septentrionalis TaxID=329112 RepID=UPI00247AEE12|nr:protein HID1 [Toxorhynchites rutilus septentrionalis]XP_055631761.1 protein HID1 [Toxorhynchites rutilus septentrionalis]XP_055631762.1 protein HID1 [Toxorhynchites rutilus septentrionalis]XP_055631764.1 protein HID1 [Toxorhynchites rutilus septentrionalis]XP_055631765.1 protein HID1 [Toxorhynchites rutilus septentrionalis]